MRENRIIAGAFGVSLLLHLVTAAATWRLPFIPEIDPALAEAAETEVEVLLIDPDEESADEGMPRTYVSLPERLASETPPDQPDYLAIHDAVAADPRQGEGDVPTADDEWLTPMVQIQREELTGSGGVAYAPQALPDPREMSGSPRTGAEGEDEKKEEADPQDERGEWALPSETRESGGENVGQEDDREDAPEARDLEEWWGGAEPSILRVGEEGESGDRGFDFSQAARGDVGLGTVNVGEYTLNTVAWDWAPWMNRFANELHSHWTAPYAYRIGIISGMTKLRLIVERDGTLSSLAILETDGHESFHTASQAALRAFAPYAPLPSHFPEENLVITLSLHYPAWRH